MCDEISDCACLTKKGFDDRAVVSVPASLLQGYRPDWGTKALAPYVFGYIWIHYILCTLYIHTYRQIKTHIYICVKI